LSTAFLGFLILFLFLAVFDYNSPSKQSHISNEKIGGNHVKLEKAAQPKRVHFDGPGRRGLCGIVESLRAGEGCSGDSFAYVPIVIRKQVPKKIDELKALFG